MCFCSHLSEVGHSIDDHQKQLYLESTFHDVARARSQALHSSRIVEENQAMFKRLMAVHTRRPSRHFNLAAPDTTHVANLRAHARYVEHQRVREDTGRLVERLEHVKTFVNERGTWDAHAQSHEEALTRLSHNPKVNECKRVKQCSAALRIFALGCACMRRQERIFMLSCCFLPLRSLLRIASFRTWPRSAVGTKRP